MTDTQAKPVKSEDKSLVDKYEEKTSMAVKQVRFEEVPVPAEKDEAEVVASISAQQNSKDSPSQSQREEGLTSAETGEQMEKSSKEEVVNPIKEEHYKPTIQQQDKLAESTMEEQKHAQPTADSEVFTKSPPKESSGSVSTTVSARPGEQGLGEMNRDVEEESDPVKKNMESINSVQ